MFEIRIVQIGMEETVCDSMQCDWICNDYGQLPSRFPAELRRVSTGAVQSCPSDGEILTVLVQKDSVLNEALE